MKLVFTCIETSEPHETGYKARFRIATPPPEPVADGYGNPLANPRPFGGAMELFVTSEERRGLLRLLDPVRRRLKRLKFLLDSSPEAGEQQAEYAKEQAKLRLEEARLLAEIGKVSKQEFQFQHGKQYSFDVKEMP